METKSAYNFSIPTQGIGIDCQITVKIKIKGGSVSFEGFDVTPLTENILVMPTPTPPERTPLYIPEKENDIEELREPNGLPVLLEDYEQTLIQERFWYAADKADRPEELSEDVEEITETTKSKEQSKIYTTGPLEDEIIESINKFVIGDRLTNLQQENTHSYYSFFIQRRNMKRHVRVVYLRRSQTGISLYVRKECLSAAQLRKLGRNEELVDFYTFHISKHDEALEILDIAKPGIMEFCLQEEDS